MTDSAWPIPLAIATAGLDIGYVPAGPHAFFRSSGHNNSFYAGPPAGPVAFRSVANACTSFFC